jgi:hypothetical protein
MRGPGALGPLAIALTLVIGAGIDVEVAYRDLRSDPTVHGIVLTLRDVTEQRRLQRELTRPARHRGPAGR